VALTEEAPPVAARPGPPRWWVSVHLLAVVVVVLAAAVGDVPFVSLRVGATESLPYFASGYATAAALYALAWRSAARGGQRRVILLRLAFALALFVCAVTLLRLRAADPNDGTPLESASNTVLAAAAVTTAAVLFFRHRRT
jgi:hypothetical protein